MKKLSKSVLLLAMIPTLLSCSTNDIAGTYYFQLGKDNGTHFGVYLNLYNTYFSEADQTKNFDMSASFSFGENDPFDEKTWEALEVIKGEDGRYHIPGYYKLTDQKSPNGETILQFGLDIDTVWEDVAEVFEAYTGEDWPVEDKYKEDIKNSKIIDKIIYATYKDNMVYAYVPVSFEDLYYQLYWFGYDLQIKIDISEDVPFEIKVVELPEEKHHSFGTKATVDEITEINKTFEAEHQDVYIFDPSSPTLFKNVTSYRNCNSVQMGLMKK